MTTERERHRCYHCRTILATKRRGVVKVVPPAVPVAFEGNRVWVRCKCGQRRWIKSG